MLVVAGDWNARTGPVDTAARYVLGKFAVGTKCTNGDRLVILASANRLVVSSTRFEHPQRHLVTWFSTDGRTRHQIDNLLVQSRWALSVIDSRAYNGAQAGSEHGSNQAMVSEPVLLPLFKKGDKRKCSNYRSICLIDVTAKVFTVILLTRFQSERDQRTRPNVALGLDVDARIRCTTYVAHWRSIGGSHKLLLCA